MICLGFLAFQSGLDLNVDASFIVLCAHTQRIAMNQGKLVFSQLMAFVPLSTFRRCVARHRGDHKVQNFTCMDQFLTMAFAQLTYRESLRDIEINLRAQAKRLYRMGLRCKIVSRNTLAMPQGLGKSTPTSPSI